MRPPPVFRPCSLARSQTPSPPLRRSLSRYVWLSFQAGFGQTVKGLRLPADDLPDYVERLLRTYLAERADDQSFSEWVVTADEAVLA